MAVFPQPEQLKQPTFSVFRDRKCGNTAGREIDKMDQLEVKQLLIEWNARVGSPSIFITDNAEALISGTMRGLYPKYIKTSYPSRDQSRIKSKI